MKFCFSLAPPDYFCIGARVLIICCSSAKRMCLEQRDSVPAAKACGSNSAMLFEHSNLAMFCDECLFKVKSWGNDSISRMCPLKKELHLPLLSYLESLNRNSRAYELAKGNEFQQAIAVLLDTHPRPLSFAIYRIPPETMQVANKNELNVYENLVRHSLCKRALFSFILLYRQVLKGCKDLETSHLHRLSYEVKRHLICHSMYTKLKTATLAPAKLAECFRLVLKEINEGRRAQKGIEVLKSFYDTAMAEILVPEKTSIGVIDEVLTPYLNGNFRSMSFCALYHFINYLRKKESDKSEIYSVITSTLLSKDQIEEENIWDILRIYEVSGGFSADTFGKFVDLVSTKIRNMKNREESTVISGLHEALIERFIENFIVDENPLFIFNNLLLFNKLQLAFPGIRKIINQRETKLIGSILEHQNAPLQILQIAIQFCSIGNFNALKLFLAELSLDQDHCANLLYEITNNDCGMSTKIAILYELVNCRVLKPVFHRFIMESAGLRHRLAVTYALALGSFLYRIRLNSAELFVEHYPLYLDACNMALRLIPQKPIFFSREGGVLFVYGMLLIGFLRTQSIEVPEFGIDLDKNCTKDQGNLRFYMVLWDSLRLEGDTSFGNPCYIDICCIKVYTFRIIEHIVTSAGPSADDADIVSGIRDLSSEANDRALIKGLILDLIKSNIPIDIIYEYCLKCDSYYADYLLLEYFIFQCLMIGEKQGIQKAGRPYNAIKLYFDESFPAEIDEIEGHFELAKFKELVNRICVIIYKADVNEQMHWKEMHCSVKALVLRISNIWFWETSHREENNMEVASNKELQVMRALQLLFYSWA